SVSLLVVLVLLFVFFFQAEDGIRDRNVTVVQTCALPISRIRRGGVYICFTLLAVLCTVLAIFALVLATPSVPGLPLLVALGISIALVAVAWWGLSHLRCYRGTSRRLVAMALWWGASAGSVLGVFTA